MTAPTFRDACEALVEWHDGLTWRYCPTCAAEGDHHDTCPVRMARAAIAASPGDGWVSVADRLPEPNVSVLAWIPTNPPGLIFATLSHSKTWWAGAGSRQPTHWRPLPPAPESEGKV